MSDIFYRLQLICLTFFTWKGPQALVVVVDGVVVPLLQHSIAWDDGTDYKTTRVCHVCLYVTLLGSYGRNSQSILMKLCTVVRNPKCSLRVKIKSDHSFPLFSAKFSPLAMPFQWQLGLNATDSNATCKQIVAFDSSKDASRRSLH